MAKIDTTETMNSLFGGLSPTPIADIPKHLEPEQKAPGIRKEPGKIQTKENEICEPKWLTLDKVTVLLTTEQKAGLDRVSKKIMKHRSKDLKGHNKERITTNTIIRALIDHFLEIENSAQMDVLSSEDDVKAWIKGMS